MKAAAAGASSSVLLSFSSPRRSTAASFLRPSTTSPRIIGSSTKQPPLAAPWLLTADKSRRRSSILSLRCSSAATGCPSTVVSSERWILEPAASFARSYKKKRRIRMGRVCCVADDKEEVNDLGVNVALSMLKFYKREISPLLPSSCRYVPTCSEYSMQAYKRYGVAKGTILTAWHLYRCNPLGGQGYDPPRWFGEEELPKE